MGAQTLDMKEANNNSCLFGEKEFKKRYTSSE